ncbi:MAG: Asp-tRNA(Asn)/Glu-tRNA(Gln) amidotransferase subunit GatB [Anaerolineae bacterium]|nr:Asp-tRNA(Asn)/Glu-tRNA(Gln) amidotransferase subunit GatB [Anaerolineae bacterium]NUQ05849.1 Asp-tRNA(Asn)/Glu-tRNA(Gln) amidotransferase subunit GatB [Anaerolineae bacterium]
MSDWTPIVGLEIHAELFTRSKMFSACPVVDSVTAPPNTAVDPVSMGLPGSLPVINREALEMAIQVGLALHCAIPPFNQFARKSYFYPDLPKGYQISQYDHPISRSGYLDIDLPDGNSKRIRIRRAHLEEDTGKLVHTSEGSLVDYNRAGVPLLEIVTEPDINSPEEAEAFARKLRGILRYLGVNDGDMSKGVMRIEPNISVKHKDDIGYRTRTEVKNLNSIRSVFRSIAYETTRQIAAWESDEGVRQATMGWDEARQRTVVQRFKESAEEYRYFPEPDLPIVEVSREWVEAVRAHMPELPDARRERFISALGLTAYDAGVLTAERAVADYFEAALVLVTNAKALANWIIGGLFTLVNRDGIEPEQVGERVAPGALAALVNLVEARTINKQTATEVLNEMWETGGDPAQIVAAKGLAQVSDGGIIEAAVAAVLAANAESVRDYLGGKEKVFGALMGQVMRELKGKGDPAAVRETLAAQMARLKM